MSISGWEAQFMNPMRTGDGTPLCCQWAFIRYLIFSLAMLLIPPAYSAQVVINAPPGSELFGRSVTLLPNGNFVVTDPRFSLGTIPMVGAAYLFRPDGTLVSTLLGTTAYDSVGTGVVVLENGNFVVLSPGWNNGAALRAGAATFASGTTGISGAVSPENSLVGDSTDDFVGTSLLVLANGNYVVGSPFWDNGAVRDGGAVTFALGASGINGVVSPDNSLVGSTANDELSYTVPLANGNYLVVCPGWDHSAIRDVGSVTLGSGTAGIAGQVSSANSLLGSQVNDQIGSDGIAVLINGNFVVRSSLWNNGTASDAGAVTFGSGDIGVIGTVSPTNSLVGSSAGDRVGYGDLVTLTNGNYVVVSPLWSHDGSVAVGAATFGPGLTGISGPVSPTNSLVGSTALDTVGSFGVTALTNGNYVVQSGAWDRGAVVDAGAATFASGSVGVSGTISPANSLVGRSANDYVGGRVTALANGNYVVGSQGWKNSAGVTVGAATFGSGITGATGEVSAENSLIGSSDRDDVGSQVTALANGNYVVTSSTWNNGTAANAGAVTFGPGTTGIVGEVSPLNSLVGTRANDAVGYAGAVALTNGNYVVPSRFWDSSTATDVGAATFGFGTTGTFGPVSPANSLVGATGGDNVGDAIVALANGNYLVIAPNWDNGAAVDAGAVTFGPGNTGIAGAVSSANSLVGTTANEFVGNFRVSALANGNYVIVSTAWDNGAVSNAGAVTLGLFNGSVTGPISNTHSVLGVVAGDGLNAVTAYDQLRNQLVVGLGASRRLVLHRTGIETSISIVGVGPNPSIPGQTVTFTALIAAMPAAPTDGEVVFAADTGERCVDATPVPISPTTAEYACSIAFATPGIRDVVAEYTESLIHAYSGSSVATHHTVPPPLFADGFETR